VTNTYRTKSAMLQQLLENLEEYRKTYHRQNTNRIQNKTLRNNSSLGVLVRIRMFDSEERKGTQDTNRLEFCNGVGHQKTRMMSQSVTMCAFV